MKFLTAREAAEYLNISYPTFIRLRKLPNAPRGFKPLNRKVLYRAEDLDNWIANKTNKQNFITANGNEQDEMSNMTAQRDREFYILALQRACQAPEELQPVLQGLNVDLQQYLNQHQTRGHQVYATWLALLAFLDALTVLPFADTVTIANDFTDEESDDDEESEEEQ